MSAIDIKIMTEDQWMSQMDSARRNRGSQPSSDYERFRNAANDVTLQNHQRQWVSQAIREYLSNDNTLPAQNNEPITEIKVGLIGLLFNILFSGCRYCYTQVSFVWQIFSTMLVNPLSVVAHAFETWVHKETEKRKQDLEEFKAQTKDYEK